MIYFSLKKTRKPKGCGEQTAFFYAPTLYTLIYLESTNKLNAEQKEKGISYLRSGYKRQLMFRKNDGSFSAFPNRKSSVWLTSFVIKLFCVSSKYIEIDHQVIKSGLKYLFKHQDINGFWSESNPVMHKQLIGGINGRVPLTASILSTFSTCSRIEQINLDINQELVSSIQKAENFLNYYKTDIKQSNNAFKIALVANSLIDSLSYRDKALELLNYLSSLGDLDEEQNKLSWKDEYPIEVASLVLLSLAEIENQKLSLSQKLFRVNSKNNSNIIFKSTNNQLARLLDDKEFIDKSDKLLKKISPQSIVNYLNSQKTFTGGFDSTQDTILALSALSLHYRNQINLEQLSMNLNCDISTLKGRFKRNLQFNNENALVMKRLQLDVQQLDQLIDEELSFTTKGNGLGFMSVKLKYNVILPEKLCKFDLNIELKEWRYDRASGTSRKGTHRVLEDKKFKPTDEDKFIEEPDDKNDKSESEPELVDEFEKMFGKDLMKDLGLDDEIETSFKNRKKRNINKMVKRDVEKKSQTEKIAEEKKLTKNYEEEFEKLKQKDDEQEEIILRKLDHYFELEEDNKMFKYEIDLKKREKRSIKDSLTKFMNRRRADNGGSSSKKPMVNNKRQSSSVAEENIRIISGDNDNLIFKMNVGNDSSFAVYKLKICAQHLPNYDTEMTIIEIGLLTGFEIDYDDLKSKVFDPKVNKTFTKLSKFELTGRTVILYLESIAHGRPDCYTLKLRQTSQVANLQSGVVKVYDYYKKGKHQSEIK